MSAARCDLHHAHTPRELRTELMKRMRAGIESHGHAMIGVSGGGRGPSFTYTVGLTDKHGFELLLLGMNPEMAGVIINDIAESLDKGFKINPDEDEAYCDWTNMPLKFKRCNESAQEYVTAAQMFYSRYVTVLQVVLCDREGKFPGEEGFDHAYMSRAQPLCY